MEATRPAMDVHQVQVLFGIWDNHCTASLMFRKWQSPDVRLDRRSVGLEIDTSGRELVGLPPERLVLALAEALVEELRARI